MLLAIDVGNTNMVIGVFEGKSPNTQKTGFKGKARRLLQHWRMETKKERTSDEFGIFFKELFQFAGLAMDEVEAVIISNVVPQLEFNLERMCERYFKLKPRFVNSKLKLPFKIGLKTPQEIGADRLVNNAAAILKYGSPLIVVDFGTATTFDFIDKSKVYRGGCICPGIAISNEALFQHASKLPRVEIRKPKKIVGTDTVESIQAGIFYGYVGMVDEIVRGVEKERKLKCKVVATGGFIGLISQASKTIKHYDPFLTLDGLRLLYETNFLKR
ncbi:MAG TPA: type III pantothenate kinase [bacterium]|nr:type III pantothenate kinase [bacterium]